MESIPLERSRTRSKLLQLIVLVIALALVVAFIGGSYYLQPKGTLKSLPSALETNVSVDLTPPVPSPHSVGITVSENNTLAEMNNVTVASNWKIANLVVYPCVRGWPLGVGLLKGHYVTSNVSQGTQVPYPNVWSCPPDPMALQYLIFLPHNSTADAKTNFGTHRWVMQQTYTYQNLDSGEYTVVACDEWGHLALAYFSVKS